MADLGKVVITDGGNYSTSVTYEKLTFVHYQGDTYMTLKTVKGVTPTDDGVNYRLFCKSAELATATKTGIVMPDGTTTAIDNSGKISVKKATTSAAGIVKPATSDFVVASDGTQTINKSFSQASSLSNISTSDSWLTMMGKIAKSIATTISLNTNALLKSAMSGIDANDANKVPNSAFIHTLVERIGMGTNLVSGLNNLTAGLNSVKQQVDQQNSDMSNINSIMSNNYTYTAHINHGAGDGNYLNLWVTNTLSAGQITLIISSYGSVGIVVLPISALINTGTAPSTQGVSVNSLVGNTFVSGRIWAIRLETGIRIKFQTGGNPCDVLFIVPGVRISEYSWNVS